MTMKVNDIFIAKLNEIQSRIPVKLNIPTSKISFSEYLDSSSSDTTSQNTMKSTSSTSSQKLSSSFISNNTSKQLIEIEKSIAAASKKYGVDADLIRSIIKQESDFNPLSLSPVGAEGLMQLMPSTSKSVGIENSWDIAQNIDGGTNYFKQQLDTFSGDISLALAAYNAGPYNVKKYNGIPPFSETQNYVTKILNNYKQYSSGD